jgi:hypothetical protein
MPKPFDIPQNPNPIKSKPTAPARPLTTRNRPDRVWISSVPIHRSHPQTPGTGGGFVGLEGLLPRSDELMRHVVEEGCSEGHVRDVN